MGQPRLGEVIATRRLTILGKGRRRVTVRVGRPRRVRAGEWACPVEFAGMRETEGVAGRGVGSCQALVDALAGIHFTLEKSGYKFRWNSTDNGTGFPRPVPYTLGAEFTARVHRHIDRELERFLRLAKRRLKRKAVAGRGTMPSNKPLERAGMTVGRPRERASAGRSTPSR
jgi:hypothetical protein